MDLMKLISEEVEESANSSSGVLAWWDLDYHGGSAICGTATTTTTIIGSRTNLVVEVELHDLIRLMW